MRIIKVVPHQASWQRDFDIEKPLLSVTLQSLQPRIHHIGSTSVPGLAAKPVIDILIEVNSLTALDKFNANMRELHYQPRGEYGITGRRYYQKGGDNRSHQIHAFEKGSADIVRHLAFRDYLIQHPAIAAEYAELKHKGTQACNNGIADYCAYKNDFIQRHQRLALTWQANNIASQDY